MSLPTANLGFPRPAIPVKPVLSWPDLHPRPTPLASVLAAGEHLAVTSGRVALALALQHAGIGAGNSVLVPAHHCTAMIAPVVHSGARPVFYRIHATTQVDLHDIASRIDSSTRALLVVHYHGFPQPLDLLHNFCKQHGLLLIEDCAHACYGEYQGRPLGSYGDYAIASPMKFFANYDGGYLVSARQHLDNIQLTRAGLGFEIKAALNALERGFEYQRLSGLRQLLQLLMRGKDWLWQRIKRQRAISSGPSAADGDYAFDPHWINKRMSLASRAIIALSDQQTLVRQRRDYYSRFLTAVSDLPGCRPLFPQLDDGVVPYMFPLLVDHPHSVFPALKQQGVPILRFGEFLWDGALAESQCETAAYFSQHLLQFPCHQTLTDSEFEWMLDCIRLQLLQASAPARAA